MTDPIADMLTRIRNSLNCSHKLVEIPYSKMKLEIAKTLKENSYIEGYKHEDQKLIIELKYSDKDSVISNIKRISKPGRRVYIKAKSLRNIKGGFGMSIISTPKGLMTNRQAKDKKLGGEVICEIW